MAAAYGAPKGDPGAYRSKRLSYIAAATAALRSRVDALKAQGEPEAESGDYLRAEDIFVAEAVMTEIKNVKDQLRPLSAIAAEFKRKWDARKAQLIAQREAEIAEHLKQESEVLADRAERATEEELSAATWATEEASRDAAQRQSGGHRPELQNTVELWKQRVPGARTVKYSAVDKALRHALERVADWAADEERQMMQQWTNELSRVVTTAHTLDEEMLVAAEDTQSARRAVLEGALSRHSKGLLTFRTELQDRFAKAHEELREMPTESLSRRRKGQMAVASNLAKQAKSRLHVARNEAHAALEAQVHMGQQVIDAVAAREQARCSTYAQAVRTVGPRFKETLDTELMRARDAIMVAQAQSQAALSEEGSPIGSVDLSGFAGAGGSSTRQSARGRRSVVPGAHPATRPSIFQVGASAFTPTKSGRRMSATSRDDSEFTEMPAQEEGNHRQGGRRHRGDDDDDDDRNSSSGDSIMSEREVLRIERAQQVAALRAELQKAQLAVAKGEWGAGAWQNDMNEAVNLGRAVIRDAEAALEGQATVFSKAKPSHETISEAFVKLAVHARNHAVALRGEWVKSRNAKAGLVMSRAELLRKLLEEGEEENASLENDALPLISRLTRETEVCVEVGKAMAIGEQRFPVRVVAGAWRRAVIASLPLLAIVWARCGTDAERRDAFVDQILAVLAKTREGTEFIEQHAQEARDMVPKDAARRSLRAMSVF